ncbi:hypothetical protein J4226_00695 [Candidatus Pacearchaeota archaeon]|nr:hypothetical protein [Candidatus Pacearchaeota archaeon]
MGDGLRGISDGIDVANVCLRADAFEFADLCFRDTLSNFVQGNFVVRRDVFEIGRKCKEYSLTRMVKLSGLFLDAELVAGKGRLEELADCVRGIVDIVNGIDYVGAINGGNVGAMISELKHIENLAYLVAIPCELADAELFHEKGFYDVRDLILECVFSCSGELGMDCDAVVMDVLKGKRLF